MIRLALVLVTAIALSGCRTANHRVPADEPLSGEVQHTLERVNNVQVVAAHPIEIDANRTAVFTGWAFDSRASAPASGVRAVAGEKSWRASYGLPRGDVASVFHNDQLKPAGWQITIPAGSLRPGVYQLGLQIGAASGVGFYKGRSYTIIVR